MTEPPSGTFASVTRRLHELIATAVGELYPDVEQVDFRVTPPKQIKHGDFAANVALVLAKRVGQPPRTVAEQLQKKLSAGSLLIARIDIAGPGFLNIFVNWHTWGAELLTAPAPTPASHLSDGPVVIEHTSINPNKAAHIGHLRNACLGDALARLFRAQGAAVEVQNYIDDLGLQVADTVVGFRHVDAEHPYPRFGDFCSALYAATNQRYKTDPNLHKRREPALQALEHGGNNVAWLGNLIAARIVAEHVADMGTFGINYDLLVWERDVVGSGLWEAVFAELQRSPRVSKPEQGPLAGCWVLHNQDSPAAAAQPTSTAGDDLPPPADNAKGEEVEATTEPEDGEARQADKVLVRSNGIVTYVAKDIAYHLWKYGLAPLNLRCGKFGGSELASTTADGEDRARPRAGMLLTVIDQRQEYTQNVVQQALAEIGHPEAAERFQHVSYGVVSLSYETACELGIEGAEAGQIYKMSGREGVALTIPNLLTHVAGAVDTARPRSGGITSHELAVGAIRYFMLRYNRATDITFDMQRVIDFQGNSGIYLMYQYARICSIMRKAGAEAALPTAAQWPTELADTERALLQQAAAWPDILADATSEFDVSGIATYAFELATRLSKFYEQHAVLKAEQEVRAFRLWLIDAVRQVLASSYGILGIATPAEM